MKTKTMGCSPGCGCPMGRPHRRGGRTMGDVSAIPTVSVPTISTAITTVQPVASAITAVAESPQIQTAVSSVQAQVAQNGLEVPILFYLAIAIAVLA